MTCSPIVSLFNYAINLIIVVIVSKNNPTSYLSHTAIVQLRKWHHTNIYITTFVQHKLQPNQIYMVSSKITIPINPSGHAIGVHSLVKTTNSS